MDAAQLSALVDTLRRRRHSRAHLIAVVQDNPQLQPDPEATLARHRAHLEELDFVLGALDELLPER